MLDKITRLQNTVIKVSSSIGLTEDKVKLVQDAASLAMSDLATAVVTEFTSLAGIMGRHYALRDGYLEEVCELTVLSYDFHTQKAWYLLW